MPAVNQHPVMEQVGTWPLQAKYALFPNSYSLQLLSYKLYFVYQELVTVHIICDWYLCV